jgi:hypothetical protein
MGVTRHAAVVPFARLERRAHIQALIDANPETDFVVVINGRGVGARFERAFELHSEASAGAARNAGAAWLRERCYQTVSFLDDDDYYGPAYLAEARRALEQSDVVHKGIGFVRFDDGLWLFDNRVPHRVLVASSISARVESCPRFADCSCNEEFAFTREARARGLRESTLPPFGFVYNRTGGAHAYGVSRVQFLKSHGPAAFIGAVPNTVADLRPQPTNEEVFLDMESRLMSRPL